MAEAGVPDVVANDPYKLLLYKKALRRGKERENTLRINIVGNFEQGKTSLTNQLIGRTPEHVTTTNGIDITRYKCQTSGDGIFTPKFLENESQEYAIRVATIANSAEIIKRLERQESNLVAGFKQPSHSTHQLVETKHNVSNGAAANSFHESHDIVEVKKKKRVTLSPEELVTFSDVEEKQKDTPPKSKKHFALSPEELVIFSDVIEKQKDTPPKCIDIWDFGGQYIFYATHTLFHSRRALYLLVFDLTKPLETIVRDEEFPGETGDRNMKYFARFWLESIDSYVGQDAQVILVGTHKDKLEGHDPSGKEYFESVRCLFDDTELLKHIQKEQFAVDNYAISDPGIADLIGFILKKHEELTQPIEVPARWISLEKALRAWQMSKIISFQDVIELDKEHEYPLQDEEEIKLFLHYHHDKGTLFYDEANFVCLDPRYLIDAFKCIITSEQFYKDDPDMRPLFKTLSKDGLLSYQVIDKAWSNSEFMKHRGALLGFLKKQNIIAEVEEHSVESGKNNKQDGFIVPSLLKNHSTNEDMDCFLKAKTLSQVRFSMKFEKQSCVHMIYSKTLAAGLGVWKVECCRKKRLLFENVCVFRLNDKHAGILEIRKDSGTLELRVVNRLSEPVENLVSDEFRRSVESIVLREFGRVNYLKGEKDKLFLSAYRCNHVDHGQNGSIQLTNFEEDEVVFCPDNVTHESFDYKKAKEEWSSKYTIEGRFPNMQLTEKILSKLAQRAIGKNWQLLAVELAFHRAEIEHIEEENRSSVMQIYNMLLRWKCRLADKATLDMLVEAMKKCQGVSIYWDEVMNIRDKYLREQKNQTDVTKHDAEKYALQCGKSKTECIVETEDTFGDLQFIKELQNIEIEDTSSSVTFTCELNKINDQVDWYFRNQLVYPSNKYAITVDRTVHMLTIKDISEEDEGKYKVLVDKLESVADLYIEDTEEERDLLEQHRKKRKSGHTQIALDRVRYKSTNKKYNKQDIKGEDQDLLEDEAKQTEFNREESNQEHSFEDNQTVEVCKADKVFQTDDTTSIQPYKESRAKAVKDNPGVNTGTSDFDATRSKTTTALTSVEADIEGKLIIMKISEKQGLGTSESTNLSRITSVSQESVFSPNIQDVESLFDDSDDYKNMINKVIDKCWKYLLENMDPQSMLDVFPEKEIFEYTFRRDVVDIQIQTERSRKILTKLRETGKQYYHDFKVCLVDTKQYSCLARVENAQRDVLEKMRTSATQHVPDRSRNIRDFYGSLPDLHS